MVNNETLDLTNVKASLKEHTEKDSFLSRYVLERGLPSTKAEYEKIVFYELVFVKNICNFSVNHTIYSISPKEIYSIAQILKIKPSKVSAFLKDIFYSGFEKGEFKSPSALQIICKYISKDRFEKEELAILLPNPIEQEIVERFLLENNARYDRSFNRKIIKIPFVILDTVFNEKEKLEILEKMKQVSGSKIDVKIESINKKGKFVEIAKQIVDISIHAVVEAVVSKTVQGT